MNVERAIMESMYTKGKSTLCKLFFQLITKKEEMIICIKKDVGSSRTQIHEKSFEEQRIIYSKNNSILQIFRDSKNVGDTDDR